MNNQPYSPIIDGPTNGKIRENYNYNVTLISRDDKHMVAVEINFGDGTDNIMTCDCGQSWRNGTVLGVSHKWDKPGSYNISGRVLGLFGDWSAWSIPLVVTMPKFKQYTNILQLILHRFIHRFPFLSEI
jgi:hypothetical protein